MFDDFKNFGLTRVRIFIFLGLAIGAAFFEGIGMAMFLPVLDYVEQGLDVPAVGESNKLWLTVFHVFQTLHIDVSLLSLLGAVSVLLIIRILFMYFKQVYFAWLFQDIPHRVRTELFKAYINAEYAFFDRSATGKVINLITTETQRLGSYINGLLAMTANFFVIIAFVVLLSWISLTMTLLALGFIVTGGMVVLYYIRYTKDVSLKATDANNQFAFLVVERFISIRLFKLIADFTRENSLACQRSENVRNNLFHLNKLKARIGLLLEPTVVLAGGLIFYYAVNYQGMSLSQIGLFMMILLRLMPLCKEVLSSRQTMHANYGSMKAIRESLHRAQVADEHYFSQGTSRFQKLSEGIAFKDVTFIYPGQDVPALDRINVLIPANRITAIVGPSGAGKSTFVDLLPRLRLPREGEILIDNLPAEEYDLQALRRSIAFVSQDSEVINDTVMANMLLVSPQASEDDIWSALEKAKARGFVKDLPDGLSTVLGEKGVRLSGGQRQRLALARAFLQKAPILILDEPTSALDSEVEQDIQDVIMQLRQDELVTVVIIAHRMSTIRNADKIIVFADGRITQDGTHEELMATETWYSMVNELQKT
ncbi:MAG: ABC transporter ATP-binding protein [Desulfobulbaceae bacterium]|nr:ABC transporter ATP-binding protein [Desulfobulbaceae bacterium]